MLPYSGAVRTTLAALLALLALSACAVSFKSDPQPTPSAAAAAPTASPAPLDYNTNLGNNRPAAHASVLLARRLYQDGAYWEVHVVTTPAELHVVDPTDPASMTQAGAGVSSVRIVMATESGSAITIYRKGGHDHERAVLMTMVPILQAAFPQVGQIQFDVYYGESDHHATGTWTGGADLAYTVNDGL